MLYSIETIPWYGETLYTLYVIYTSISITGYLFNQKMYSYFSSLIDIIFTMYIYLIELSSK